MGLFNTIRFEEECPSCAAPRIFWFQTKYAASMDYDKDGRFALNDYRLGEKMRWWPKDSPEYDLWLPWGPPRAGITPYEFGVATCQVCGLERFARIEFSELVPKRVSAFAPISMWPRDPDASEFDEPSVLVADYPELAAMVERGEYP